MASTDRIRELVLAWLHRRANDEDVPMEAMWADCPELQPEVSQYLADHERFMDDVLATFSRTDRSSALMTGPTPLVPGYELLDELGRGAMGVVYRARQKKPERIVALKVLVRDKATEEYRKRFQREANAAAALRHDHIVHVYEVGEVDGGLFFSQEFVPGETLAQRIQKEALPPRDAAGLLAHLATAVAHAHEHGVVHRDLKPSNILLTTSRTPKIVDFGIAMRLESEDRQTQAGQVIGTPAYMAPEQADGNPHRIGAAADIYALGAILYELLTGRPPFHGSVHEIMRRLRQEDPISPRYLQPTMSRDLETICLIGQRHFLCDK